MIFTQQHNSGSEHWLLPVYRYIDKRNLSFPARIATDQASSAILVFLSALIAVAIEGIRMFADWVSSANTTRNSTIRPVCYYSPSPMEPAPEVLVPIPVRHMRRKPGWAVGRHRNYFPDEERNCNPFLLKPIPDRLN